MHLQNAADGGATGHSDEAEKVFLSITTRNEIKLDEIDDGASDAILPAIYSDIYIYRSLRKRKGH